MIDYNDVDDFTSYIYSQEFLLQKFLTDWQTTWKDKNKERIDINSRLTDVARVYNSLEKFEKEYEERKRIAPNWEVALTKWISEIESSILGYKSEWIYNGFGESDYREELINPIAVKAYNDINEGKNRFLHEYTSELIEDTEGEKRLNYRNLYDIGLGVALAYKLHKIKEELREIHDFGITTPGEIQPSKQKLNWIGTAGEFGAIIDLLIERGYIEEIPQKKNKVKICLDIFNIKSQKNGQPISPSTLLECFGKDKHQYASPNNIRIPPSINYGKE